MEKESWIIGRHTQRVNKDVQPSEQPKEGDFESEKYPGITNHGLELIRREARENTLKIIRGADPDAVIFFGGTSEEDRTKSTSRAEADYLKELLENEKNILFLDENKIYNMKSETIKEKQPFFPWLKKYINDNKDKKIIINFPLSLGKLSLSPDFRDEKTTKHNDFSKALDKASGEDPNLAAKLWFSGEGKVEVEGKIYRGASPLDVAKKHLREINRLRLFVKEFSGERQNIIKFTGHGWNIDALLAYLADQGKINESSLEKFGGKIIKQSENGYVKIEGEKAILAYRGKEYEVPMEFINN